MYYVRHPVVSVPSARAHSSERPISSSFVCPLSSFYWVLRPWVSLEEGHHSLCERPGSYPAHSVDGQWNSSSRDMYKSTKGRQIWNTKSNPNTGTNPCSPYCEMRFILGSEAAQPCRTYASAVKCNVISSHTKEYIPGGPKVALTIMKVGICIWNWAVLNYAYQISNLPGQASHCRY